MPAPIEKYDSFGLYRKSIEIFHLSRGIADHVTYHKDLMRMRISRRKVDRYASDLVMDSLGLVPKITEAITQTHPGRRLSVSKSLEPFIDRLYQKSVRLERLRIPGKDFVKLLRAELIQLRELHMKYINSLL